MKKIITACCLLLTTPLWAQTPADYLARQLEQQAVHELKTGRLQAALSAWELTSLLRDAPSDTRACQDIHQQLIKRLKQTERHKQHHMPAEAP